jgi:hypothetical protein
MRPDLEFSRLISDASGAIAKSGFSVEIKVGKFVVGRVTVPATIGVDTVIDPTTSFKKPLRVAGSRKQLVS